MNWKDLGQALADKAPLIGTLLGGAGGSAVGSLVASVLGTKPDPEAISKEVAANPDAVIKLRQLEADKQVKLQELATDQAKAELAAATANSAQVAATMQAEAAADHWPTYSWRPFIGFMFGAYITSLWLLPLFGKTPVTIPADVTVVVGAILGVASYFRGKMQADPSIPTDNRG